MHIIRLLLKLIVFFIFLMMGAKILDYNRALGTCILVLIVAIPFWTIFIKNRIDKWWALIPAWFLPVEMLIIIDLEGGINELFGTLVLLVIALPFAIFYIIRHKKIISRVNIFTHSLLGSLMLVGLFLLYLTAFLLTPYSGIARNIYYGGAYVGDFKHFPSRTAMNNGTVFYFTNSINEISNIDDNYLEVVHNSLSDHGNPYDSFEEFLTDSKTTSLIVIKDDIILYEWYGNGYTRNSTVTSFSVAKSFVSSLIGFAIDDGFIQSEEDPITVYIPELLQRDKRFENITIKHLLTMTSGIHYKKDGLSWGDDMKTYYAIDMRKSALSVEIEKAPGEEFLYNNYNPLLLGLILERVTGKTVTDYLEEKIWLPLGMEAACTWSMDSQKSGFEKMQVGINARAIDFAKFGRLYLNKGNWNHEQLLSAEWIEKSTMKVSNNDPNNIYGYAWWIIENGFAAKGAYGQYIYIYPDNNMIILRFGTDNNLGDTWDEIFTGITKKSME